MKATDLYSSAHLFVAAIRVLEHQKSVPPSIEEVCEILSFSLERGNLIYKKLKDIGIIEMVEGAYGTRLFIRYHLKIEEIPKGTKDSSLDKDLRKFQDSRKDFTKEIESFQAKQAEKKKDLFAEIEKKLKKKLDPSG